jgi:hypothetical protein
MILNNFLTMQRIRKLRQQPLTPPMLADCAQPCSKLACGCQLLKDLRNLRPQNKQA